MVVYVRNPKKCRESAPEFEPIRCLFLGLQYDFMLTSEKKAKQAENGDTYVWARFNLSCLNLIAPFWYISAPYQASFVEPWFGILARRTAHGEIKRGRYVAEVYQNDTIGYFMPYLLA